MNKRKLITGIISMIVLVVAVIVFLGYRDSLDDAMVYLNGANPWILLLLIPNIILMYYAAGRMWYPYLKDYGLSAKELTEIHYELNFVNTVVPSAAVSGLLYSTERLREYDVKPGQTSWLYVYRYIVSITTNWIGIIGATVLLLIMGKMQDMPVIPLILTGIMICAALIALLAFILLNTGKKANAQTSNSFVRDMRYALSVAKSDKKALVSSWAWGMAYTVLEDLPFLVVAWAMGHPELFLQMVVAAGAGIIVGVITPTPGGIGGFDGAMIYLLGGLGTNYALASMIVLTTRILVLASTTATGYPFWQRGMIKISQLQKSKTAS